MFYFVEKKRLGENCLHQCGLHGKSFEVTKVIFSCVKLVATYNLSILSNDEHSFVLLLSSSANSRSFYSL